MELSRPSLEEVETAYEQFFGTVFGTGLLDSLASLFPTWRLLAEGAPVPLRRIAHATGKSLEDVHDDLRNVEDSGYFGLDDNGDIINFFGLLLSPTPHSVTIGNQLLYAG